MEWIQYVPPSSCTFCGREQRDGEEHQVFIIDPATGRVSWGCRFTMLCDQYASNTTVIFNLPDRG